MEEIRRENHRLSIKPYGKTVFFLHIKRISCWTCFLPARYRDSSGNDINTKQHSVRIPGGWSKFEHPFEAKGMESAHEWTYLKRSQKKKRKKQHGRKNSMVSSLLKSREPQTLEVAYFLGGHLKFGDTVFGGDLKSWARNLWFFRRHVLWCLFDWHDIAVTSFVVWLVWLHFDYTLTTLRLVWLAYLYGKSSRST